jgi:hypothetical protein
VNDTTWSTIVGTWRSGRLELYVDGFSRASSPAAATNSSALFGIYRWGWGFSTSQDFIALIACFAASWTPAMIRRWNDPFGFLRPMGRGACALWQCATRHAARDRHGVACPMGQRRMAFGLSKPSRDRPHGGHPDLVRVVECACRSRSQDFWVQAGLRTRERQLASTTAAAAPFRQPGDRERRSDHHRGPGCQHAELLSAGKDGS